MRNSRVKTPFPGLGRLAALVLRPPAFVAHSPYFERLGAHCGVQSSCGLRSRTFDDLSGTGEISLRLSAPVFVYLLGAVPNICGLEPGQAL